MARKVFNFGENGTKMNFEGNCVVNICYHKFSSVETPRKYTIIAKLSIRQLKPSSVLILYVRFAIINLRGVSTSFVPSDGIWLLSLHFKEFG